MHIKGWQHCQLAALRVSEPRREMPLKRRESTLSTLTTDAGQSTRGKKSAARSSKSTFTDTAMLSKRLQPLKQKMVLRVFS